MNFTEHQRAAIVASAPAVNVLAGAGSGKTATVTERVKHLVTDRKVAPRDILCVTFTRAAALEMRERLTAALGEEAVSALHISTFHSWAASTLRRWPAGIDRTRDFVVYDEVDVDDVRELVMNERRAAGGARLKTWRGLTEATPKRLADPNWVADRDWLLARYAQLMREWDALDYGALITGVRDALAADANARAESARAHVIVDEVQDTAPLPFEVFDLLAPDALFTVGDYRQAIYSFMGADPDATARLMSRPGAVNLALPHNFRSTPQIVDVANRCARAMGLDEDMIATSDDGPPVTFLRCADREHEAAAVAHAVRAAIDHGESPSEIAILAREWRHLDAIEDALRAGGVPALRTKARADLWKQDAPRLLLRALRVAANPRDGFSEAVVLSELVGAARAAELRAAAMRNGAHPHTLEARVAEAVKAIRAVDSSASVAAITCADALDLAGHFRRTGRQTKAEAIEEAIGAIFRWQAGAEDQGLRAFLAWVAVRELAEHARAARSDGLVTLTTIHGSKGLEWNRVIVVHQQDEPRDGDDVAEERRVFYVACTRARRELAVTFYRDPSPFVREVAPDLDLSEAA
jgi:DNA helicase-2/ATP-dependent DNA helicase PcrA